MSFFDIFQQRSANEDGATVLEEEMEPVDLSFLNRSLTRRQFLAFSAASTLALVLPFRVDAKTQDVIFIVTDIDETRESFGAIVENYVDPNALVRFYAGSSNWEAALFKLARYNRLTVPDCIVQNGQEIKVPQVLIKRALLAQMQAIERDHPVSAASKEGYIVITIDSSNPHHSSIGAIADHYTDPAKSLEHYRVANFQLAIEKLATENKVKPPHYIVSNGQKIRVPTLILKEDVSAPRVAVTQQAKATASKKVVTFQSPFGGQKKPALHPCWEGTGQNFIWKEGKKVSSVGSKHICPFDRYSAIRGTSRTHRALDLWGSIGTSLYPLFAGKVVGAGYYYQNSKGKKVKFAFSGNNGRAVKIQNGDWTFMYIHLSKVSVKIGDQVTTTTTVGKLGISGNANINNPHVHVTLAYKGQIIDPLRYLSFLE